MTLLHDNDRSHLEDGVRTMLHRLAADVTERPPAWDDLVGRHEPARRRSGCRRRSPRCATAAPAPSVGPA